MNTTTNQNKQNEYTKLCNTLVSLINDHKKKQSPWTDLYWEYKENLQKLDKATEDENQPTGLSLEDTFKLFTHTYILALATTKLYLDKIDVGLIKSDPMDITQWAASLAILEFDKSWVEILEIHKYELSDGYTDAIGKRLYRKLHEFFYRALEDITIALDDYATGKSKTIDEEDDDDEMDEELKA